MLARGRRDPKETEFVGMGLLQVGRQQRLIGDLLDVFAAEISSLEHQDTDPAEAPDLLQCVAEVLEGLRPAFLVKKVALRSNVPDGQSSPWRVIAEKSRLERVLYNLLENALRFAPPRSAVAVQLGDEDSWFCATVADEGPGVAKEILPHLFQRFVTTGRQRGKSGLGLFFCRVTLERWGGAIACEPATGEGACFRIRLRKTSAAGTTGGSP